MNSIVARKYARLSLEGLSVGDAFGQRYWGGGHADVQHRRLFPPPWTFTDDTVMAIGITEMLEAAGDIQQETLAQIFARNYRKDPLRGYGGSSVILGAISRGYDWRKMTAAAFAGKGSSGNGAAMRVAPLGAYFADDFPTVVDQARRSAEITHAHPEGQAGAIAVAVAAAYVATCRYAHRLGSSVELFERVLEYTPKSDTRHGIQQASVFPFSNTVEEAVTLLGNGSQITAPDTVPFALWCAARHLGHFEEALWTTVSGLGDCDTTCAIVGGIVVLSTGREGIPSAWLAAREPLGDWITF